MKKGVSQIATKTNGYAKSTWLFACLAISLSSCKKENFTIVNLNNNRITTLGHSGMGVGRVYPMIPTNRF